MFLNDIIAILKIFWRDSVKRYIVLLISLLLIFSSLTFAEEEIEEPEFLTAKAKVIEVISDTKDSKDDDLSTDLSYRVQKARIKILNGKFKNKEFTIEHSISGNFAYDIVLEPGSKVMVSLEENTTDDPTVYVTDFVRDTYLLILVVVFISLLIVIGGLKGFKSVITLLITGVMILFVMMPLILKGYNPIIVTILSAMFIALITFFIIGGINAKSIAALVGTTGGVVVAGMVSYIIGSVVNLTGLSSEEAGMLMYIPQEVSFDFRSLLFSGIIVGTLGAVMDVAMSISSSMYELRLISPDIEYKSLVKSGLNIGKDIMGTMSNTLILAYTGSSIPLLLLFMSYNTPVSKILNLDLIATEIVRALVGSIGLVIAIPITALCAGLIFKSDSNKKV